MPKLIFASIFALVGIALAALSFFNGQAIVALSLVLAGVYVGFGVAVGVSESVKNPVFQIAAAVISAIGLLGVFIYNRAFDVNLQRAHIDALYELATLEMKCRPMSAELRDIQKFGVAACATQRNSDQIGAVIELGKGLHFGPTLTLADAAVATSQSNAPNYCAKAYKAAVQLCPSVSLSVPKISHDALISVAR